MPNAVLAARVLQRIETHPEEWGQSWFAERTECGTAYCFAGLTVRITHPDAEFLFGDSLAAKVRIDGEERWIPDYAARLLELSYEDEAALFSGINELDDLRAMVNAMQDPAFRPGELRGIALAAIQRKDAALAAADAQSFAQSFGEHADADA